MNTKCKIQVKYYILKKYASARCCLWTSKPMSNCYKWTSNAILKSNWLLWKKYAIIWKTLWQGQTVVNEHRMPNWSQIDNYKINMLLQGQTVANVHQPLWQRQTVVNEHQIQNWSQIVNYEKNMLLQCQTVAKVHTMPHWS